MGIDLANDKDVDLVVCSVRVERHFATIAPSLRAGKNVFVEWPLGSSASEARELLHLKQTHNVKMAIVGLQARSAPIIRKVKELVEGGRIGGVLSMNWVGAAGKGAADEMTGEKYEYFARREVGGNLVSIHFGHAVDYLQFVLGYGFQIVHSILANRRPEIKLLDDEGKVIDAHHKKTSDDTIFLTGTLKNGIHVSFSLRGGKPFPGQPGLDWRIYGERGEIWITASGTNLQMGYDDMRIEVVVGEELEEVVFGEEDQEGGKWADFPMGGRNVGRVYEGLVAGHVGCGFEDAVERHEFIEGLYRENGYLKG